MAALSPNQDVTSDVGLAKSPINQMLIGDFLMTFLADINDIFNGNRQAPAWPINLIMDKAYEGNETRQLALDLGFTPVVPPKSNRLDAWQYDKVMYKRSGAAVSAAQGV